MTVRIAHSTGSLQVPRRLGQPKIDQLYGSRLEQWAEIIDRTCHGSFGSGRSSVDLHEHRLNAFDHSIYDHCCLTVQWTGLNYAERTRIIYDTLNRPGMWVWNRRTIVRLTFSLRTLLDWDKYAQYNTPLYSVLSYLTARAAPQIIVSDRSSMPSVPGLAGIVKPIYNEEMWVTVSTMGSRNLIHELRKHSLLIAERDITEMDIREAEWRCHPLIKQESTRGLLREAQSFVFEKYCKIVAKLRLQGVQKTRARAAAVGLIGNSIETPAVLSASLAMWNRVLSHYEGKENDVELNEFLEKVQEILDEVESDFGR